MPGIGFPNNLNPETTKVLDDRCAGTSADTNNIVYPAQGLLRYETDINTWKYYDNTNNWVNLFTLDTNFTSLTNGDLIKYDGSNFINFAPTYLDGAGITDNYLIKVVNGVTTQTTMRETSSATSTALDIVIGSGGLGLTTGSIETEIFNTTKTRMHLTSGGDGITITSDGRVGIGVVAPEEDLHIDGNIQLDTGGNQRSKIMFYDGQNQHEHAEIDALGEGTNGGALVFYTKVDNGSVTEKLRINNIGAIGIGGANYGNPGQVLVSNGSGSAVSWVDQTDTTYSPGTGLSLSGTTFINTAPDLVVSLTGGGSTTITGTYPNFTISSTDTTYSPGTGLSLSGTTFINTAPDLVVSLTGGGSTTITGTYPNFTISSTDTTYSAGTGITISGGVISIGQNVGTDDSPTFISIGLNKDYTSFPNPMPSISFNDTQQVSPELAKIEAENATSLGGNLAFYTKRNTISTYSGQLRKSLVIGHNGGVTITSESIGLTIESENGNEQGFIYNDIAGNYDFIIDTGGLENQSRGVLFKTAGGQDRMRITNDGKIGIGTNSPSEILDVEGNIQITDSSGAKILKITNNGEIQLGATFNAGQAGYVLTSAGPGQPVSWYPVSTAATFTSLGDTPSSLGTSGQVVQVNTAGTALEFTDNPFLKQITLGHTGTNQGILNLQDFTNIGTDTIAQIKGFKEGTNGGELKMFTKVSGGSLTERMTIQQNGLVSIKTDNVGLLIASQDGTTEQGYIYNSNFGTKDFVIEALAGSSTKGILFRTNGGQDRMQIGYDGLVTIKTDNVGLLIASQDGTTEQGYIYNSNFGTKDFVIEASAGSSTKGILFRTNGGQDRLRIGYNGQIGIGGANYGSPGQVIVSNGSGSAVSWANQTFYEGARIHTGPNSQYGLARLDFTNGDAMTFNGSLFGTTWLQHMFTQINFEMGSVTGTGWRGSQLLALGGGGQWGVYDFSSNSTYTIYPSSDDRIKTSEQIFSGETYINYVKQIIPKKYKKYGVILTKEEEELLESGGDPFNDRRTGDPSKDSLFNPQVEYGVIAQDIHKISGLEDIVSVGSDEHMWKVDYRSIDTITLGAVKGLIDKIEILEERIKTLENRF